MPYIPKQYITTEDIAAEFGRLTAFVNLFVISFDNVTPVATVDGSNAATTMALANSNKAKVNTLLTVLKAAGIASGVAAITTPDGIDPATTQTLSNANKATINLILAALAAANIAVSITAIATADGIDAATTQTLANANKAKINALLPVLVAQRFMSP